ncbi:hypothetical protein DCAR_0727573 [Daucus carota subsp. sativus]|uniref:Uncharacterized protein n=1 Tax=Daucus carota subsp. sativus TaxID=79200 RepID=A0AAF1B9E9_DAUCS|nr:hypothetical protein DCAR_0727573 [Daucus carota subsp. sativus]
MASLKASTLLLVSLLVIVSMVLITILGTLGMVCKCCNGRGVECKTEWLQPCPHLRCHPWKQQLNHR